MNSPVFAATAAAAFVFSISTACAQPPAVAAGQPEARVAAAQQPGTGAVQTALPEVNAERRTRPYELTEEREPCVEYDGLRRPFFGDLHVHTAFSQDASTQGTRNTPRDAYRFARGEPLGIQPYDEADRPTRSLQLDRPLDFAAVTDHAEMLGETRICRTPGSPGYDSLTCRLYRYWPRAAFFVMNYQSVSSETPERYEFCGPQGKDCLDAALTPWRETLAAAEGAYDRSSACRFTTFVGYEWTGAPSSNNLHRNVIFRNRNTLKLPISYYEAHTPQSLWRQLAEQCHDGCEALTIPHNSNLSNGLMFQTVNPDGSAISAADAAERAANEPLVEVMQHKGDSECLLGGGSEDELCGFEKLPYANFAGKYVRWLAEAPNSKGFLRNALKEGLAQEEKLGVNPFKFGLIGSTDTHLGTPGAVSEAGFEGHGGAGTPAGDSGERALPDNIEFNPGGIAVLWAEENTRDSLFAAMRRREAYATSGPRMVVRFFGGWDYPQAMCDSPSFAAAGYAGGTAMGGDLAQPPAGAAPRFAVRAQRDSGTETFPGTPLQRIQIVKGWLADGETHEKVFDVAGDAGNGAAVDPATCRPTGSGFDELCTVWTDAEFVAGQRAFYYARVLENPTCRWSQLICLANGVDCNDPDTITDGLEPCCAPDHKRYIQERAWTSPIWYAPKS